jgi:hypothetical protein
LNEDTSKKYQIDFYVVNNEDNPISTLSTITINLCENNCCISNEYSYLNNDKTYCVNKSEYENNDDYIYYADNNTFISCNSICKCDENFYHIINNKTCIKNCPSELYLYETNKSCLDNCNNLYKLDKINECVDKCINTIYKYSIIDNLTCVTNCPNHLFSFNYNCLNDCPEKTHKSEKVCLCNYKYYINESNFSICLNSNENCPNNYPIFLGGIICLAICTVSIYLITRLNQPTISLLGFFISTAILFTFMHSYGNESILWFIIAEIFIVLITIILKLK